jgi:hypothetical protein
MRFGVSHYVMLIPRGLWDDVPPVVTFQRAALHLDRSADFYLDSSRHVLQPQHSVPVKNECDYLTGRIIKDQ